MSKKLFSTIGILLFTLFIAGAQTPSWQWGKRGGSSTSSGMGGPDETVVDMATDMHGNIYVLSSVQTGTGTGVNVDGHPITGWGVQDILLTSFKCDGTYRWSKDLGTNQNDNPGSIKTDTLGGVYIMGAIDANVTVHIDTDTSWGGGAFKDIFIAKFDTAGVYKWFRMPQPDTATIASLSATHGFYDMDVDEAGNIFLLSLLPTGAYSSGAFAISSPGIYMLKYNSSGIFQSFFPMQISYSGQTPAFKMKRDHQNGRFYITGTFPFFASFTFGSMSILHFLYLGAFNNSGISLWTKQDTNSFSNGPFARPDVDLQGNVYAVGKGVTTDVFNSYTIVNPLGPDDVPIVVKLDSNGTNVWATSGTANDEMNTAAITVNGSEVDMSGGYPGKLKWGTDSISHITGGCGYSLFIARINKNTAAVSGLDTLKNTCGHDVNSTAMASDKYGNFYVGGNFAYDVTINGTTLISAGGGSDFFVAKYGTANCDTSLISLETISPGLSKGEEISVYPNPATEELNIMGIKQSTTYRLLNITGMTIQQGTLQPGANTIQMRNCAPGMYILQMNGEDGTRNIVKVVKQ